MSFNHDISSLKLVGSFWHAQNAQRELQYQIKLVNLSKEESGSGKLGYGQTVMFNIPFAMSGWRIDMERWGMTKTIILCLLSINKSLNFENISWKYGKSIS